VLKFLELVLKNLGRNRVRTLLTGLAVLILATIYSVVSNATAFIGHLAENAADTRLIIREKWITPSRMPNRYANMIAAIPGVEDWTLWHNYVGYLDQSHRVDRRGWGIATRLDNLREMHPGLEKLDPAVMEEMRHDRTGAVVGAGMMKMMDWHVGQRFTMSSMNYAGKDLDFKILGVLPDDRWAHNFFFRDEYFAESTGDKNRFHMMWLRVRDPETGKQVAAQIEKMFDKSDTEVLVETESKGIARVTDRTKSIVAIVDVVVSILLIDMLVILSNSISISTRERRREMAIFKVLGFQPFYVMALVIGEAMIVGGLGGALGGLLAFLLSSVDLPVKMPALLQLSVTAEAIPIDMLLGTVVGFLGSVIPAWNARNIKVTEVFSKIA
jgi:putative ABC transport system permease protein